MLGRHQLPIPREVRTYDEEDEQEEQEGEEGQRPTQATQPSFLAWAQLFVYPAGWGIRSSTDEDAAAPQLSFLKQVPVAFALASAGRATHHARRCRCCWWTQTIPGPAPSLRVAAVV